MSCNNCNDTPINIPSVVGLYTTNCTDTPGISIKDYVYTGVDLPCSEIFSGNSIETVIQKLDAKLCGVIGDFSSYNTGCLVTSIGEPILTQQQFVEASSAFSCQLRDDFEEFRDITFRGYKDSVNTRFKAIEIPGTISTTTGITATSTIQNTLNILSGSIDNILNVKLSLTSVNWSDCFIVSPLPTSIAAGFNALIDQICLIKEGGTSGDLPTFNNVGSCLAAPVTASDTLVATVNKIKTRLCELPDFDINDLTWGCTTKPSIVATDLQAAFQTVLNTTNDYKQNKLTFSADFAVTPTGSDPCGGKTVSLAVPSSVDRYVAAATGDSSPGTLQDKLLAGTGVTFDYVTTPGKVIINSNSGGVDVKVKTEVTDPTAGYLEDKIQVSTNSAGVSITKSTDLSTHKVALGTNVNGLDLWNFLLAFLDANPATYEAFCQRVTDCLPDCIIPPNVTVTYNASTTTTTTTTVAV